MEFQTLEQKVLKKTEKYVTRIILNDSTNGNVLSKDNLVYISVYLEEAVKSSECRVILFEGKDGVFCRGLDFKSLVNNRSGGVSNEFTESYKNVLKIIHQSPKPVISVVDGEVLAGGMGFVLASDIVIATERSSFGLSEVLFGLIPAYVFPFLLERVTFKTARYLVLMSKKFDANEANKIGVVDEVVANDNIEKEVKKCIKKLLYSSPDALALTKSYSNKLGNKSIDASLEYAQEIITGLLNDAKNLKAIKLFLEGNLPDWAVACRKELANE